MKNESTVLDNNSHFYFASVSTSGSLNTLEELINKNKINISASEILRSALTYPDKLDNDERDVFKAYFLRQANIVELQSMYNFKSINYTEQILYSAIQNYLTMLKNEYGTK